MLTLTKNSLLLCSIIINATLYSQTATQQNTKNHDPIPAITATIDAKNSEVQLENLKEFFSENEMELTIQKLTFNEQNEITGIHIVLKKEMDTTEFSSHSNLPIPKITLGFREGTVFISSPTLAMHNSSSNIPSGISWPNMTMDSLLQKHRFAFHLDSDDENEDFFGVSVLKEMMEKFMTEDIDTVLHSFQHLKTPSQSFKFTDNPSIHKLIIIDGKESNFETLNTYAIANQLAAVDILQPETAISIYGNKAKDGVIIATTKN